MGFDQAAIEKGARDAELPDSGKAEAELRKDLNRLSPGEQLDFLKSVAKQTEKDHNADQSLPTLELTGDGAGFKQVKPTEIPNYHGENVRHDLLYRPSAAPAQIIRVHAEACKPAL